jgi:ankyrin repeat protein
MKKLVAVLVGAVAVIFVYSRMHHKGSNAPLPPAAETEKAPPPAETPLADAVQASLRDAASRARVEAAIAKGANPNSTDADGRPCLTLAVRNNDVGVMEVLLAHGADANARDRAMQWTPLMHAAFMAARDASAEKAIGLLLAKGADPNADKDGTTALQIAVNNTDANAKQATVIEMLLKAGAKPGGVPSTAKDALNTSPMVLAAWNGKTAAALALARGGADAAEGARTARNNKHPELAALLEKMVKGGAPAPAPAAEAPAKKKAPPKKKKHR